MTDLTSLTLAQALDGMEKKHFSSVELTDAFLGAIEQANPHLNAFVVVTAEKARERAKASDAKRAAGKAGPLEGAPLGIKDLFCTEGVRTTACSGVLGEFTLSKDDVKRISDAAPVGAAAGTRYPADGMKRVYL